MLELTVSMHLIIEKKKDLDHHRYLSPFLYVLFNIHVITLKILLFSNPGNSWVKESIKAETRAGIQCSLTSERALCSTRRSHRFGWWNSCLGRRHSQFLLPWGHRGFLDKGERYAKGKILHMFLKALNSLGINWEHCRLGAFSMHMWDGWLNQLFWDSWDTYLPHRHW